MLIVDGHNLIPKIPGLSLRDIDDEERLIALLQEYARIKRKKVLVFFDGAPPGQSGERVYGALRAHFVPTGRTADDAIRQYLDGMGKTARTATVVSSDRQVQANARELHARVLPSEDFARQIIELPTQSAARDPTPPGKAPASPREAGTANPDQDVAQWIDLFGLDPTRADEPIELSKKSGRKSHPARQKPAPPAQARPAQKKQSRPFHGFPKKP